MAQQKDNLKMQVCQTVFDYLLNIRSSRVCPPLSSYKKPIKKCCMEK